MRQVFTISIQEAVGPKLRNWLLATWREVGSGFKLRQRVPLTLPALL